MSEPVEIPEEFPKIIKDFVSDIINTFPEYEPIIMKWWKPADFSELVESDEIEAAVVADAQEKIKMLFNRCVTIFPERFFDILYQNEDIFKTDSTVNTEFLPGISFKYLWQCDISEKTKETIWKYLQMVLLSIIGSVKNKDAFGDTAKLFKTINEDEFKGKLQETLEKMQSIFENTTSDANTSSNTESESDAGPKINMENMPSADDIHGHITGMLGGKLGDLAREIAEETAENLDIDMENVTDVKDVFQKLFKNPGKLMNLVKNVGDKLDSRIKSGEINEKELMSEASDIMSKMKNMPGMGNIQSMLNKMGMGGLGKVNTAAMEAKLNQNLKLATTKDRIRAKAEANAKAKALAAASAVKSETSIKVNPLTTNTVLTDEEIIKIFGSGEKDKVERTPRGSKPQPSTTSTSSNNNKKKKGKK